MRGLLTAVTLAVVLTSGLGWAGTIYVKPDGTGDVATIQDGVDLAAPGDTVLLASGTFQGAGNYNILVPGASIVIRSETGNAEDCMIDCEGHLGSGRYGFNIQSGSPGPEVEGITVANGNVLNNGGAVYSTGSPVLRDCVFLSNQSGYAGGAVYTFGSGEVVIKRCTFASNQTGANGGAIYIEGVELDVTVDSCTFYDNQAASGGAVHCEQHEATAYIRNSVFYENSATDCGGAISAANMEVYVMGCTFFANSAPEGSGICAYTVINVDNCIIAYGSGGCGYYYSESIMYDPYISCTDIYGNEGGNWVGRLTSELGVGGNFEADPAFCEAGIEPYDLQLCDTSPCLPGNHPDGAACGLIGALGEGCICIPTETQPAAWGAIKAMYR